MRKVKFLIDFGCALWYLDYGGGMKEMARYNVNAAWDDPFEPRQNRRSDERFRFRIKIGISVTDAETQQRLVGPGIVKNLSLSGAYLVTKHRLTVGQRITVAVPTKRFPVTAYLPAYFMGPATVTRVEPDEGNRIRAAIQFGEPLTQNMEFAVFVNGLHEIRDALSSK